MDSGDISKIFSVNESLREMIKVQFQTNFLGTFNLLLKTTNPPRPSLAQQSRIPFGLKEGLRKENRYKDPSSRPDKGDLEGLLPLV